ARQAEALAREELAHAAELRVRRRRAYRQEFPHRSPGTARAAAVETLADFRELDGHLMAQAAAVHRAVARALEAAGDGPGARLVAALAERENAAADAAAPDSAPHADSGAAPAALLQQALRPLEAASEHYETIIAAAADEDILQAAQA